MRHTDVSHLDAFSPKCERACVICRERRFFLVILSGAKDLALLQPALIGASVRSFAALRATEMDQTIFPPFAVQSLALTMVQPMPLQEFLPLHDDKAVLHELVPLHELIPLHFTDSS